MRMDAQRATAHYRGRDAHYSPLAQFESNRKATADAFRIGAVVTSRSTVDHDRFCLGEGTRFTLLKGTLSDAHDEMEIDVSWGPAASLAWSSPVARATAVRVPDGTGDTTMTGGSSGSGGATAGGSGGAGGTGAGGTGSGGTTGGTGGATTGAGGTTAGSGGVHHWRRRNDRRRWRIHRWLGRNDRRRRWNDGRHGWHHRRRWRNDRRKRRHDRWSRWFHGRHAAAPAAAAAG